MESQESNSLHNALCPETMLIVGDLIVLASFDKHNRSPS